MTYKQAYDKIIDAYFKDEIKPYDPAFCFCGTLCDNSVNWFLNPCTEHYTSHGYLGKDFVKMEVALWSTLINDEGQPLHEEGTPEFELELFDGMSAALDVLKEIHESKGEIVDEPIETFKKRELSQSNSMQPSTI